ncbi:hypothetical protein ACVN42_19870 [Escherichia coli]
MSSPHGVAKARWPTPLQDCAVCTETSDIVCFTLLENALDSVETGLEYFGKSRESHSRSDYKQCLLNLFQAAELLLKVIDFLSSGVQLPTAGYDPVR